MIAVVMASGISATWLVLSIAVTLAVWVVLAHLCSPKVKRAVVIGITASALALNAPMAIQANDGNIVIEDPCKKYDSSHPMWWIAGCWML